MALDPPDAFHAGDKITLRAALHRINAGAVIGVDEVHADGALAQSNFAFTGIGDFNVFVLKNFETPI